MPHTTSPEAALAFAKLSPGGNPTILLTGADFAPEGLPWLARRLLDPLCLGGEQVGALYDAADVPALFRPRREPEELNAGAPGQNAPVAHLQMMGGEFCVNAARAAALWLARAGRLRPLAEDEVGSPALFGLEQSSPPSPALTLRQWGGFLHVSGVPHPVEARVAGEISVFSALPGQTDSAGPLPAAPPRAHAAVRLPLDSQPVPEFLEDGLVLVRLPGITHLLVDVERGAAKAFPLPNMADERVWRAVAARLRRRFGLDSGEAAGVVWHCRKQCLRPVAHVADAGMAADAAVNFAEGQIPEERIWPVVWVAATDSEYLETACGSASLALALLRRNTGGSDRLWVRQPSGEALIASLEAETAVPAGQVPSSLPPSGPSSGPSSGPLSAWIGGPVALIAEGTVHPS